MVGSSMGGNILFNILAEEEFDQNKAICAAVCF